jgi:glycosyltransferase involved in cell wall biosynthesis
MKILFDHPDPFLLMHGGFQIQIEQTKTALDKIGVQVEYLRWWDDSQSGEILHYFGKPQPNYVGFAHQRGMKVVISHLLTGLGSRPAWLRWPQKLVIAAMRRTLPEMVTAPFGWEAFRTADACIQLTEWEAHLMREMFSVPPQNVHVIPNGVDDAVLNSAPAERGPWLVCTGAITERKRIVELAQAAVAAQTPVRIIGKPYADSDPYAQRFLRIASEHPKLVRYEGPIHDRAQLARAYREARGFVLLSTKESLSLSALEAAACGCPLLLSDLPWARTVFQQNASYCSATANVVRTSAALRRFYDAAPGLPAPPKPVGWEEVARQLKSLYENLLKPTATARR